MVNLEKFKSSWWRWMLVLWSFILHSNKTKQRRRMGRIKLHCWQRCYDKAHVWSPRLTSLGKIWSNQIFGCFRLLITKPWCCSMDFVPSNFPTNPSWFKSFAMNWRNTHLPSTPASPSEPTCGEWSINDRRLTWDPSTRTGKICLFAEWHITNNHDTHAFTTMVLVQCTYIRYHT